MWSSAGSRSRRTSLNLAKIFLGSLEFISDIARIYALANARITITSKVSLGGVSKDTIGKKTTNLIGADTGPKSLCTLNIALQWFKAQSKSRWFFYFFSSLILAKKHKQTSTSIFLGTCQERNQKVVGRRSWTSRTSTKIEQKSSVILDDKSTRRVDDKSQLCSRGPEFKTHEPVSNLSNEPNITKSESKT